jgi:hypothetical protein
MPLGNYSFGKGGAEKNPISHPHTEESKPEGQEGVHRGYVNSDTGEDEFIQDIERPPSQDDFERSNERASEWWLEKITVLQERLTKMREARAEAEELEDQLLSQIDDVLKDARKFDSRKTTYPGHKIVYKDEKGKTNKVEYEINARIPTIRGHESDNRTPGEKNRDRGRKEKTNWRENQKFAESHTSISSNGVEVSSLESLIDEDNGDYIPLSNFRKN